MPSLTFQRCTSLGKKNYLLKWDFPVILALIFGSAMAMKTPITNPFRDFSKLRLEQPKPSPMPMPLSTTRNPMDFYHSTGTAATENVGVMYKPMASFHENINMNSYTPDNQDEIYEMNPATTTSQIRRPTDNEDENEIHMPIHNSGDGNSGSSMGSGGIDYNNEDKNRPHLFGKMPGNNPEGLPTPPEDMFFIPSPPSPTFMAEIEYDSATGLLNEKGVGGLFDNDQENEQDNPDYFYNNQDQQDNHGHNNNEHNQDRREGDGYEYGGSGNSNHGHNSIGNNNPRFNGYGNNRNSDYGDY